MSWNHRVIRSEQDGEIPTYAIHECHYDKEDNTIPTEWAVEPVAVMSDTRDGLSWVLAKMTLAVAKPVLEERDGKLVEVEP